MPALFLPTTGIRTEWSLTWILAKAASWLIEIGLGLQVRDYDNYFLNLNGRIYLGGSTAFALLGCAFLYYIAPRLTDWFLKRSRGERVLTCLALTCLGIADVVFTILTKI